jgi:hypothetical protein
MLNAFHNINASCIVFFLCSAYKYLSSAPDVKATEYHSVAVTADLQNFEGRGTPRFYQLQYRVSAQIFQMPLLPRQNFEWMNKVQHLHSVLIKTMTEQLNR